MNYFQIKNFRGVETKEDSTDQDRTVARELSGLLPVPQGALSNGPKWSLLHGIDDLADRASTVLSAANAAKAHILRLTQGGRVFLIVWSVPSARALGFFEVVSAPGSTDLDATSGVSLTYPGTAPYADKDPSALWFASRDGNSWLLGNGVDANLVSTAGVVTVYGPSAVPADVNDRSRVRIPPATTFRRNERGNLFAAGNAAQPLRVWITATPSEPYPIPTGIQSLNRDFIDVHAAGGATRITALSLYGNYITAHTDATPVNLYGVNNTADGWACQQAASAANASAINPACVGDSFGDSSFYLGRDLEIYEDQAVRAGPWEKRAARDQSIVTAQSAGVWNREMLRGSLTWGHHVIFDADTRLFWVFARSIYGPGMVWAYYERTRGVAGPIHYPDAVVSAFIKTNDSSVAAVITQAGEILYARLNLMVETEAADVEAPGTALGSAYEPTEDEPTPTAGVPVVGLTEDRSGCIEKVGGVVIGATDQFSRLAVVDEEDFTITEWFNNATLARFECPWQDLGGAAQFKQLFEVELTFDRDSRAYVGVCVENERGHRRFKWCGVTHGRNKPLRAAFNIAGVRFRVRVVGVVFNDAKMILRDARLGFVSAGMD